MMAGREGFSQRQNDGFFLERLRIDSFGDMSNRAVGPFSPGMNLVFGKNEAGKTTISAFIGGVLFGWEEARGARNTYKPENADRSGTIFFEGADGTCEAQVARTRNADGLIGSCELVSDIDRATFKTMFALDSDELRTLSNTTDMTARLLTAGSGTGASPAHALATLDGLISDITSRKASVEDSLLNLSHEIDEVRASMNIAEDEAARFRVQDGELREIEPERVSLQKRQRALNGDIEALTFQRATMEETEARLREARRRRAEIDEQKHALERPHRRGRTDIDEGIIALSDARERALREALDDLQQERSRCEHRIALARQSHTDSQAAFEAYSSSAGAQEAAARAQRKRRTQLALSVVLPLAFVAAGVPTFMHGREINSLSITAVGLFLIVFALFMAGAALVMLFRPNKEDDRFARQREDRRWIMIQDEKKLEACEEEIRELDERIRAYLGQNGLSAAEGSLRQARQLLDEAAAIRADDRVQSQKVQSCVAQIAALDDEIGRGEAQRADILGALGMGSDDEDPLRSIKDRLSQKTEQRDAVLQLMQNVNRRYGELVQELAQARAMRGFDELKQRYQTLQTRLRESYERYAVLLLARRDLEAAIASWESKSQPEVYRRAGALLAQMTDDRWVRVKMGPDGSLRVIDAVKTARDPLHLSMGTCQQLYLSLRISLLLMADNVGRAIPVLCDDILVNFDSERRRGAARALFELARQRQVIFFTCHEEIVSLMQDLDPGVNLVRL